MASLPEAKPTPTTADEILRVVGELPLSAAGVLQNQRDVEGWRRSLAKDKSHFPKEDFGERERAIEAAEKAIRPFDPRKRRDAILPLLKGLDELAEVEVRISQQLSELRTLEKANALGPAEYKRLRALRRERERTRQAAQKLRDLRAEVGVLLPESFARMWAATRQAQAAIGSLPMPELARDVRAALATAAEAVRVNLDELNRRAAGGEATWAELERLASGTPAPTPPTRKRGS